MLGNEGSTSTTTSVITPILKADITNIAGNPNFIYLIKHSLHERCFAQGKSGKGVGYVMGVLVMTARSVASVSTCLSMAEKAQ